MAANPLVHAGSEDWVGPTRAADANMLFRLPWLALARAGGPRRDIGDRGSHCDGPVPVVVGQGPDRRAADGDGDALGRADRSGEGVAVGRRLVLDERGRLSSVSGVVRTGGVVPGEEGKQVCDGEVGFGGVAQDGSGLDAVGVGPAFTGVGEIPVGFQIGNDLLDCAFGEPAACGDVAHAGRVIVGDGGEHPGVVGEERPPGVRFRCFSHASQGRRPIHVSKRVK